MLSALRFVAAVSLLASSCSETSPSAAECGAGKCDATDETQLAICKTPEDFATQPRPEKVRLHFFDGKSEVATKDLTLKNTADFQEHDARAKNTARLEIEILSTSRSLQGGTACSIAEIEFWEKA